MNEPSRIITPDPPRERAVAVSPVDPNYTPMQMLSVMTQRGISMADLKDLVGLVRETEANTARMAYVEAMAAFKAEPIKILKTKDVNIPGGAKFKHAVLADVVDGSIAYMSKHGLSHKWLTETGDIIKVTCVVTHKLGHSESTEMSAPPDTGPGRNKIQAVGSTITYLQRYTLMSLLGLAAKDMDNDGSSAGKKDQPPAPDGFDNWADDLEAVAEEGSTRLQEVWKGSPDPFRRYTVKFEDDWWTKLKNKAAKVKVTS